MPIAMNDAGEVLRLGDDGAWTPAPRAQNPETGAELYHDGRDWKPMGELRGQKANDEAGPVANFARSIRRGVTLGFADEIAAGGRALLGAGEGGSEGSFGERYDRELRYQRERDQAYERSHPIASAVGNVVGGVAGAVASAPLAAAAQGTRLAALLGQGLSALPGSARMAQLLTSTAGRGLTAGATGGALGGFGEGQGGLGERIESAGKGAAAGAVAGPVLAMGANAAGRIGGKVLDVAGLRNPETAADRQVLRALERDGLTPDDLAPRAAAAQEPAMLPDLAGRNTTNLAAVAANTPGRAMEAADRAVELRRAGAPDRIGAAVDQAFGGGSGGDVAAARDALMTQRRQQAGPLYDQAFRQPVQQNDDLRRMLAEPLVQQGMTRGLELQRLEAAATGQPPTRNGMELLDAGKRGLDDMLEQYRDPTTGRMVLDQRGRAIEQLRQSYVAAIDQANPDYAAARQAWAGPSQALDALGRGRDALTMDRDALARAFAALSPADQDFFRLGVGRAVADSATDPSKAAGAARRLVEDRQMQARLETAIPDQAQREAFTAALQREVDMAATNRAVSPRAGSQTHRLGAGADDMGQDPPGGVMMDLMNAARTGGAGGAGARALQMLYRRGQGINNSTADALAARLLETDPAALRATVARLQGRRASDLSEADIRRALANRLLLGLGAASGTAAN